VRGRCRPGALAALAAGTLFGIVAHAADAPAVRRALLVGINDYAVPRITDLRGAVNDVDMMGRVLETRLGFERANITVLKDSQATRVAILAAVDRLVAQAGEHDSVYFHYSGHGSQSTDRNGDETDGKDETIVAHDSRSPGVPDITDDEFDRRFARLRTRNVLLVFDSCHSGTVTRSAAVATPRAIPADDRDELYAGATRAAVEVNALPHVLMTGAPSDQEALDGPVGEGFYGLFSWSLARSLNENGPDASPELIHQGVKRELRRIQETLYMHPPEPQLEAPAEIMQQPLFGGGIPVAASVGRRAWVETRPLDANRLTLVGAAALGGQPGAQWAMYGPAETRFEYGGALALGTIETVVGADAVLRLENAAALPAGARAIAVTSSAAASALALRVTGVAPARAAALVTAIARELAVKEAREGEPYRYALGLRDGSWRVQDAGGRVVASVADGDDAAVVAAVARALRAPAQAAGLLALDNLASDMKLWVGVQTAAAAPPGTRSIVKVSDDPAPAYRVRRPGEARSNHNSLVIEVQTDREAWITVVAVGPEGNVNQLFPNTVQGPGFLPDGRVPANRLVTIPDSLAPGNAAGFYWDYGPPLGTDTVRVFAAADPATALTIRRHVARAAADRNALAALGSALAASTVRGIKLTTDPPAAGSPGTVAPPGEWTAASVVIQVGE
jgi:hypothetical protein